MITSKPFEANQIIKTFVERYNNEIMALYLKLWKEEEVRGISKKKGIQIMQYYYAFYYAFLIRLDADITGDYDLNNYESTYNIVETRKKLACNNIDLDEIFEMFGLPSSTTITGINRMRLHTNFIVEPETLTAAAHATVDMTHILENLTEITSYINTEE